MRIRDIIAAHLRPGSLLLNLTRPGDQLSVADWTTPDDQVTCTRDRATARPAPPANTIVLQDVRTVDLGKPGPNLVHVVLCPTADAPVESGVLDAASAGGWELASPHSTGHKELPFALVFHAPASDEATGPGARLRVVNEYRYDKLLLRLRTEHVSRLKRRLEEAQGEQERLRKEAEAAAEELARLKTDDIEHDREVLGRLRQRVLALEEELAGARKETALAAREAPSPHDKGNSHGTLLDVPRRWLASIRPANRR